MRIYSIYDRKLKEYGALVLCGTDGAVCRALREGLPEGSTMAKYPEDYDLMFLGVFDPGSGVIVGEVPLFVDSVRNLLDNKGGG